MESYLQESGKERVTEAALWQIGQSAESSGSLALSQDISCCMN